MVTVLHASDLQCGRPYVARAGEALVRFARALSPDLIVVAGDLTQRAKVREFKAARALFDRFPRVPLVVTPGNHDVPLYRLWERVVTPYRNWRRLVSQALDTVTSAPGITVVALNSSAPRRAIVGGRIDTAQIDFAMAAFAAAPADDIRALVVHHHLVVTPGGEGGRPLPTSRVLARAIEEMGVEFVLGGHVHQTHIRTTSEVVGEQGRSGVPLIACGTSASRRGRGPEEGLNSLNVVRVSGDAIEVTPHLLAAESDDFEPRDSVRFSRRCIPSDLRLAARGRGG